MLLASVSAAYRLTLLRSSQYDLHVSSCACRFVLMDLLPKSMAISLMAKNAKIIRAKGLKKKAAATKNQ